MEHTPDLDLLKVMETAELLNVSRSTVYELMRSGALKSVKVARTRRIPMAEVRKYLDRQLQAAA